MSVADKILELRTQRENIREAIVGKGGTLPEGSPMVSYAPAIYTIPAGGGPGVMSLQVPPAAVTTLTRVFENWSWVATVPLFDTSSVTNMSHMFGACTSLTIVPLFDTSKVTDMNNMFSYCTSLATVPLFDTSSVTNMVRMFNACTSLTTVPLFDTSSVNDTSYMFFNCTSLTTVPLFDTSKVMYMYGMFTGCTSLTTVPLFDTSKVTSMDYMFNSTRLITDVEFTDCSKVQSVGYMFPTANNAYSALTRLILPGMGAALNNNQTLNVRYHKMDSTALDNLMTSLGTIMAGHTVTLDIRNNPGYDTCDKSIATDKGWTVL